MVMEVLELDYAAESLAKMKPVDEPMERTTGRLRF
jgi:hypothetical protein